MNTFRKGGLLGCASTAYIAVVHLTYPATAAQANDDVAITDIVVTAQRTATTLLDTPVAVSAFGGDMLESRQVTDLRDLKTLVPGMQLGDSYGTAAITIRGIGTVEVLQGADPGVAYHLDGVYLGRSHLAAAAFFDVAQVEILRGPQGTLFGRNSTGGTVNFIPKKPTHRFDASLKAGFEADPFAYEVEGVVSGPLTEKLAGRLSVQRQYNEGFSNNRLGSGPDRLDDRDSYAVRGQLNLLAAENLEINLTVEHYRSKANGPAHYFLGTPSGAATVAEQLGGTRPSINKREIFSNYAVSDLEYTGSILKISWDAGFGNFTSSTSYYKSDSRFLNDFDGTEIDFTSTDINNDADQFYQEILFTTALSDRLDLVLGANAFLEDSSQTVNVPINFPGMSLAVMIASEIDTKSYAGFGHLTYHATDAWKIFGGTRYTHDKKKAFRANNFVGEGNDEVSWGEVIYEAGTSLDIAERTNVYLKYSKGYKGGGFESSGPTAPPFNPEFNKSWEIGLKSQLFDRRIQLAASAFRQKYSDLQVNQIVGVSNTVTNAARATIKGVEVELVAKPVPALSAEFAFSYLDARFDEFVTADGARPELGELDLAGNRLRNSPEFTLSAGLFYTLSLGNAGELILGGRYYWQDEMYFSEFNIPISSQKAVGRGDLSLEYVSGDGAWRASIFATNITDKTVFNDVVVVSDLLGSAAFAKLDTGRRIGVSLTRKF